MQRIFYSQPWLRTAMTAIFFLFYLALFLSKSWSHPCSHWTVSLMRMIAERVINRPQQEGDARRLQPKKKKNPSTWSFTCGGPIWSRLQGMGCSNAVELHPSSSKFHHVPAMSCSLKMLSAWAQQMYQMTTFWSRVDTCMPDLYILGVYVCH